MQPTYQIYARNKSGTIIGEITDYFNLKFNQRLNNYGEATFQIPSNNSQLRDFTALRIFDTIITRNNTIVWSGEQAVRHVTMQANSANLVEIKSFSFEEGLNQMYTPAFVRFDPAVDQGQILKSLVDTYQLQTGADLGYTFATIPTSMDRIRDYSNYNILEAFINMSNVIGGIDFWVDSERVIHIVPMRGIDRSQSVIFDYHDNLISADIQEDFSNPATGAIVLGAGFGSEQEREEVVDAPSRGVYGLRQVKVSEIDVSESDTLIDKGEAVLNRYKTPVLSVETRQIPNTLPSFGSFSIGDWCRLRIQQDIFTINAKYRNYGFNVEIGENGEEYVQYLLGSQ
jgi:hypothetical protein